MVFKYLYLENTLYGVNKSKMLCKNIEEEILSHKKEIEIDMKQKRLESFKSNVSNVKFEDPNFFQDLENKNSKNHSKIM